MQTMDEKFVSGNITMYGILEQVEDNKLDMMLTVVRQRTGTTEEKLATIAEIVMSDDVEVITKSVAFMSNAKIDMVNLFLKHFAKCYTIPRGSELQYATDKFVQVMWCRFRLLGRDCARLWVTQQKLSPHVVWIPLVF